MKKEEIDSIVDASIRLYVSKRISPPEAIIEVTKNHLRRKWLIEDIKQFLREMPSVDEIDKYIAALEDE